MPLDANDISELYRSHARDLLVFFTRRVYDPEVALDLVAETFAAAFAVRDQFRGSERDQALAWIYGIAHNQIGRYFRRGAVERRALAKLGVEVPSMTEHEYERIIELTGLDQLRGHVAAALAELPLDQRRAIELRVVDERPYAEVAAEMGVSEQVVRARVSRGLRTLAAQSRQAGQSPLFDEVVPE
ncbi:MAG TPA: RNA polymerase sigma factor [Thermoleophilaceae bacterium]